MKNILLSLVLLVGIWFLSFQVQAQISFTGDCPAEVQSTADGHDWVSAGVAIINAYEDVLQSDLRETDKVAALQALRRCVDDIDPAAEFEEAYSYLREALILAADSVILTRLENDEEAEALLTASREQSESAYTILVPDGTIVTPTPTPPESIEPMGSIVSPTNGSNVGTVQQVIGTYDAAQLSAQGRYLWLLLQIPNGDVYIQASNMCQNGATPIAIPPGFGNNWTMTIGIQGTAGATNQAFQLILVTVNATGNNALMAHITNNCSPYPPAIPLSSLMIPANDLRTEDVVIVTLP